MVQMRVLQLEIRRHYLVQNQGGEKCKVSKYRFHTSEDRQNIHELIAFNALLGLKKKNVLRMW